MVSTLCLDTALPHLLALLHHTVLKWSDGPYAFLRQVLVKRQVLRVRPQRAVFQKASPEAVLDG